MSLAQFPQRWPLAPEHGRFAKDLRQLRYGRSHDVYRLLFIIQENPVHVIHIQRGTQQHQEESSERPGMLWQVGGGQLRWRYPTRQSCICCLHILICKYWNV